MASLDLPRDAFLPVVFFIGNATFKTPMPPHILNQGLTQWLRQHQQTRLDPSAVANAVVTLDEIHRSTGKPPRAPTSPPFTNASPAQKFTQTADDPLHRPFRCPSVRLLH